MFYNIYIVCCYLHNSDEDNEEGDFDEYDGGDSDGDMDIDEYTKEKDSGDDDNDDDGGFDYGD